MTDSQSTPKKNLLEAITDERSYSSAIIGTYTLQGEYLEDKILPKIKRVQIQNRVVLTDTETYSKKANASAENDHPIRAGEEYYFDHVRCTNVFHPKFVLFLGRERGLALIGSANLTGSGWENNAELVSTISFEKGSQEQTGPIFAQLQSFIQGLAVKKYLPSPQTRDAIDTALEDAPWISEFEADRGSASTGTKVNMFHNLEQPILSQFIHYIGEQEIGEIKEIRVASPYFNDDLRVLRELSTGVTPDKFVTIIQPENVKGISPSAYNHEAFSDIKTQIQSISIGEGDSNRYLHAKFIHLIGDYGSCILYGSPNATTPGMLKSASGGNIELALSRYEPDPEYFDYLMNVDTVETSKVTLDDLSHEDDYKPPYSTAPEIALTSARIDDELLVVEYEAEYTLSEELELHLERVQTGESREKKIKPKDSGIIQVDDPILHEFCTQSTQVSLSDLEKGVTSDKRWISFSQLRSTPRLKQIKDIVDTGGRAGLINLMDQVSSLEDESQIIRYLEQIVDFDQLASMELDEDDIDIVNGDDNDGDEDEPNGDDGENGSDTDTDGDEDSHNGNKEKSDDENDELELPELLTEKFESYRSGLDELVGYPDPHENWKIRTERVLNFYIGGAKFILWAANQRRFLNNDGVRVEALQHIRLATEKLVSTDNGVSFIDYNLRQSAGFDHAAEIETELRVLEHVVIILYLTDELLRNYAGTQSNVYPVYERAFGDLLSELGNTRDGPIPPSDTIKEVIEEYETLSEDLQTKKIRRFCRDKTSE